MIDVNQNLSYNIKDVIKLKIAIDGPSGAGKSTIAKEISKKLNIDYLDTGAMYRTLALYFKENNFTDFNNDDKLINFIKNIDIDVKNREHSPLIKADDAIEVDSSKLNIIETIDLILKIINEEDN